MTTISLTTPKRLLLIAAALMLTLAIAAAAPALSRADVYCVHQAGFTCAVGSVDEGSQLQNALNDAAGQPSTASSPNVVTIGPGTYEPRSAGSGFNANVQYPLEVRGSGVGRTSLTDSGASAVIALAGASPNLVTLSGLTVGGSAEYGVSIANGSVDHVAVDPSGPGSRSEDGILLSVATVKDSTVTFPAISIGAGLVIDGGSFSSNEIDDVTVDGGDYGVYARFGGEIHRARLIGNATSLEADGAPVYIDDSLLVGGGVQAVDRSDGEGSLFAVNDTIVAGGSSMIGLESVSVFSRSDITIYNSIVHGFPTSFETFGGTTATLAAANDNYDGTIVQSGSTVNVSDTVTGDPAFVDPGAGDYHLAWSSPLIDAGDPGLVSATSSATDLGGNAREVRSSTGSSSPLDLGAYEYQHRAPTVMATAAPSSATTGTAITFDGSRASDPDDGDTLTYAWSFDDGATATGATVTHAFSTPGVHTATLTVTDPTGLTTKQAVGVTVTSPPAALSPTLPTPPTLPSGMTSNVAPPHLVALGRPSVSGNKVTLKLLCAGSTACAGIQVSETANNAKHLASARLSLKPGQTQTITLMLNRKGGVVLEHFGKLRVVITVTMTTAGKTAMVKTAHATLHPRRKPSHHHP